MEGRPVGRGNKVSVGCTDELLEWVLDEDEVLGKSVIIIVVSE